MLTNFNDSNEMNTFVSDAISARIQDGYRIDAKESVVDHEKDKNCTFKAVLKKDVDGVLCKTVITLHESADFNNINKLNFKASTYHRVDLVDDLVWGEETRTFSSSYRSPSTKSVSNTDSDLHHANGKIILNVNDKKHEVKDLRNEQYRFDWLKSPDDYVEPSDNKIRFNRLSDVIKFVDNSGGTDNCAKRCDDKSKNDSAPTNDECDLISSDDLEDSLIKLVGYIFGK